MGGTLTGTGKRRTPLGDLPFAISHEPADVLTGSRGKDDRNRRYESSRDAASPQDHVDEAPSHSAVSVQEGVDRLELSVGDGGLGDPRKVISVDELDQVGDQGANRILGRRDVPSVDRRVDPAADPVLLTSKLAGREPRGFSCHQCPMELEDVVDADGPFKITEPHRLLHRTSTFAATTPAVPRAARGSIRARANSAAKARTLRSLDEAIASDRSNSAATASRPATSDAALSSRTADSAAATVSATSNVIRTSVSATMIRHERPIGE